MGHVEGHRRADVIEGVNIRSREGRTDLRRVQAQRTGVHVNRAREIIDARERGRTGTQLGDGRSSAGIIEDARVDFETRTGVLLIDD